METRQEGIEDLKLCSGDAKDDSNRAQFSWKCKLCVFCVASIDEEFETDGIPVVSQETFIEGISVLCDILRLDHVARGFARVEQWAPFGVDNFASFVCCKKCYGLLAEMVSLHQIIVQTQATLKERAREVEDFVIESEDKAEREDLEYSVNACVGFRQEILQNFQRKDIQNECQTTSTSISPPPRVIEESNHVSAPPPSNSKVKLELPIAVVRLERLVLPEVTKVPISISDDQEVEPAEEMSGGDMGDNYSDAASPPNFSTAVLYNDKNDEDEDYRPVPKRRRGTGGKRGRPRKHPVVQNISRKRGRPAKVNSESGAEDLQKFTRRRRVTPGAVVTTTMNENEEEDVKNEDCESVCVTDNLRPKPSGQKGRRRRVPVEPKPKKKGGRPCQVGSRHYRMLHEQGPKHKPVYVLNPSQNLLMFFNVKFQKLDDYFQCLHPDCAHSEPNSGYFADQLTFRNFRFHVRHQHRNNYKPVGDTSKNFHYCHICETQHDSRDILSEHRRTLHPNLEMPPVLCEVCGDIMPQSQIVRHTISHKNQEEKEIALAERPKRIGKLKDITKPLLFPCDECDKTFKTHTELRIHKLTHIPLEIRRRSICDVCGGKFATKHTLEIHKRRVHLKDLPKPFVCGICNRKFSRVEKTNYDAHVRAHSGEKPFQCPQCGKSFHRKESLNAHEKIHWDDEERNVTCEFCSQVYKSRRYLRRHHLKHHPDLVTNKPIPHEVSKYKNPEQRDDFIGPKLMYPCEPCKHVYVFKSILITHLKGKHKMHLASKEDYPAMWTMEHEFEEQMKKDN